MANNPGLISILQAGNETFRRLNAGVLSGLEHEAMAKLPKARKSKGNATVTYAHELPAPAELAFGDPAPSPITKRPVRDAALAEGEGEKGYTGRVSVRITSFRRRAIDPDNLCGKYALDCLRYSGILRDDRAAEIEFSTAQKKVARKEEERTEIEISPVGDNSC